MVLDRPSGRYGGAHDRTDDLAVDAKVVAISANLLTLFGEA